MTLLRGVSWNWLSLPLSQHMPNKPSDVWPAAGELPKSAFFWLTASELQNRIVRLRMSAEHREADPKLAEVPVLVRWLRPIVKELECLAALKYSAREPVSIQREAGCRTLRHSIRSKSADSRSNVPPMPYAFFASSSPAISPSDIFRRTANRIP